MTGAIMWAAVLLAGTAAVSVAATFGQGVHMGVTALICAGFVLFAMIRRRNTVNAGGSAAALASDTAASIALVWTWAGLSMLATYQLVLNWHEWWQYVLAGVGVGALSLLFAFMMSKDAAAGRQDDTLLNIARYLTIGQFAGMLIAMVGMVIDRKMPRDVSEPDWAANGIFFFGAAALAVISANALWGPGSRRA